MRFRRANGIGGGGGSELSSHLSAAMLSPSKLPWRVGGCLIIVDSFRLHASRPKEIRASVFLSGFLATAGIPMPPESPFGPPLILSV